MNDSQSTERPLRVMFVITSMPVGGAETLLVGLVSTFDRNRIEPLICCLKQPGELGERIADRIPLYSNLIQHKFDVAVMHRLRQRFKQEQVDAVVTVGAGDKMFWGRLAARYARVPVVLSALHSTGWPDGIGRLNRLLTGITDGFIAVADNHRDFLIQQEGFPQDKVFLIPNGIDTQRFQARTGDRIAWRQRLGIGTTDPVCGIVAALRPEKNHDLFIELATRCGTQISNAHFLIVGDGPERTALEKRARVSRVSERIQFLGNCEDTPGILSAMDMFALTSHNEASPVSILEAMACGLPVVAPDVGSIGQAVLEGKTGFLFPTGDDNLAQQRWLQLLTDSSLRSRLGAAGRGHVETYGSLASMTNGYTELIESLVRQTRSRDAVDLARAEPDATTRQPIR